MGKSRDWFVSIQKKFVKSPPTATVILHTNPIQTPLEEAIVKVSSSLTKQDVAAIKIQALFRGRLARRAFRALKSLVKLQALARGARVRRQSRIALHCMHSLVRLQVRVRARQLLISNV